jgi:vacuolar iron transporter family protein
MLCRRETDQMKDQRHENRQVRDRLLKAWREEVLAESVYELVARRLPDRQAELVRRIAQVEDTHRLRLERRMHELGIRVPGRGSVRIGPWLKLQARVAPVDRLLAAREAAEEAGVDDGYGLSTGDAVTDRLFASIRTEERSHVSSVQQIREEGEDSLGGTAGGAKTSPARSEARRRLDRILGREKGHNRGGGWISDAIYGANDGLASVFGIVAGVSGATGGSSFVLTAGLSGAIASALSMATGAFMASRSEAEVVAANVARERQEIVEHP